MLCKWKLISEELPRDLHPVLVRAENAAGNKFIFVAIYNRNDGTWDSMFPREHGSLYRRDKLASYVHPIAWMEIPHFVFKEPL